MTATANGLVAAGAVAVGTFVPVTVPVALPFAAMGKSGDRRDVHRLFFSNGGFYKRGCQVKTLYPSQGGLVFLGIQPLPAALPQLGFALFGSPRISGST